MRQQQIERTQQLNNKYTSTTITANTWKQSVVEGEEEGEEEEEQQKQSWRRWQQNESSAETLPYDYATRLRIQKRIWIQLRMRMNTDIQLYSNAL